MASLNSTRTDAGHEGRSLAVAALGGGDSTVGANLGCENRTATRPSRIGKAVFTAVARKRQLDHGVGRRVASRVVMNLGPKDPVRRGGGPVDAREQEEARLRVARRARGWGREGPGVRRVDAKGDVDEPALGVVGVDDVRQGGRWAGGAGDGRVGMLEPPQSGEGGEHVDARPVHACQRHGCLGPAASGADAKAVRHDRAAGGVPEPDAEGRVGAHHLELHEHRRDDVDHATTSWRISRSRSWIGGCSSVPVGDSIFTLRAMYGTEIW